MNGKLLIFVISMFFGFAFGQSDIGVDSIKVVKKMPTNLDSLVSDYFKNVQVKSIKTDSLLLKKSIPNTKNISLDSLKSRQTWLNKIGNVTGQVGLGYQYGLLTGYIDTSSTRALSVLSTMGDLEVSALGIPVNLSYNFASMKNPFGVNNYFRVSVNMEKYKLQDKLKKDELRNKLNGQIDDLNLQKSQLKGKLGYSEIIQQRLRQELEKRKDNLDSEAKNLNNYKEKAKDSLSGISKRDPKLNQDSLHGQNEKADSLYLSYEKKKAELDKYLKLYDSIQRNYQEIMTTYNYLTGQVDQYDEQKSALEKRGTDQIKGLGGNWMQNVTKLDVGLTYPSTTALSKNAVPVKGIDFETQKGNWYTAVTAGVTMNNLMVSNDAIQNKLNNTRNLFNQFDFQNIRQKRFLFLTKTGWGTKEGSHFFVGVRYTNKAIIPGLDVQDSSNISPSVGLELDGRIKPAFLPGTTLDLVYGKTSDTRQRIDNEIPNPISSLFSSSRTHTAMVKLTQPIEKLRSQFIATVRWIDPYADMASLGVLQPNNLRYELTTKHHIFNGLDVGLIYRKDRNNLDYANDSTMHLQMIGGNFTGKFTKWFNYFGNVNFLTQDTKRSLSKSRTTENYMVSLGVSTGYKIGKTESVVSLLWSEFHLTTAIDDGLYRNYGIQHMTKLNKGQNTFSINVFETAQIDSALNKSLIIGDEWSLVRARYKLSLGLKISRSKLYGNDLGGKIEFKTMLTNYLQWSCSVQKFVLGDFYNSYNQTQFKRTPFAIMTQLNYILK